MLTGIILILIIAALAVGFYVISIYNGLITLKNRAKEAWSDIQVQLKRRYDLIPNLVEVVKGYAAHESSTLQKVIEARNMAINSQSDMAQQAQAENMLTSTLKSLFAVSENYPDLKANQNFLKLQQELTETEDRLQAARKFYNTNVNQLNIEIESFPSNIIAKQFKFEKAELFKLDEDEAAQAQKAPSVKF